MGDDLLKSRRNFKLPLTHYEQVELLGLLLSYQVELKKQKDLVSELNNQIQLIILEKELEKRIHGRRNQTDIRLQKVRRIGK